MEPLSRPGFLFAVLLIISLGACGSTEVTRTPLGVGGGGGSAGHGGGGGGGSGGTEDGAGGTDGGGGSGGVEGGCSGHEACPSSLPYCGSDRACHACLLDVHCPLDRPWCDGGACKLCGGDEACVDRGVCDPETGGCVECRDDEHCDDGRCTEDQRCVECLDGEDCESGACEEGICLAGARCSNTQPCEEGVCFAEDDNAVVGICHPRCDPVTQTGCEEGLVCAFHSAGPSGPVGGCLPPEGGLSEGEDCSGGESCELGLLCVSIFTERICSAFCDPDVPDVCGQGMVCERLSVRDRPDAVLAVCVEEDRPCQKDSDCEEGEACTLFVTGGGQEVGMVCIKAAGAGLGGDPCARGADCASGVCLTPQNTCFGGCATSDDCSENGACIVLSIGANRFNGCVGSCEHESDCGNGQGCILTLSPDRSEVVSICNPSSKPVASGEICTGDTCRSGSCFKFSSAAPEGYCSAPCGGEEHCGQFTECADSWYLAPGPDNTIGTADDSRHNIPTCSGIRCERKSDCPANWECLPEDNGGLGEDGVVELRCRPGVPGAPRGGEPCGPGCLCTTYTGRAGSFCFEPCTATADCSGNFECFPDAHRRTGTNGQAWTFDACLPLP